jgi:hypothetical protein
MTLGGGRARRLSLGAAATFAVAAVAGVVGNRLTGSFTPALILFVGLVMAGMLVSYWVDRGTRADRSSEGESTGGGSSTMPQAVQDITASAPGATAQGAMFGNIINHGDIPRGPAPRLHRLLRTTPRRGRGSPR